MKFNILSKELRSPLSEANVFSFYEVWNSVMAVGQGALNRAMKKRRDPGCGRLGDLLGG